MVSPCSVNEPLPARFCNDHLGAQVKEPPPELLSLQSALNAIHDVTDVHINTNTSSVSTSMRDSMLNFGPPLDIFSREAYLSVTGSDFILLLLHNHTPFSVFFFRLFRRSPPLPTFLRSKTCTRKKCIRSSSSHFYYEYLLYRHTCAKAVGRLWVPPPSTSKFNPPPSTTKFNPPPPPNFWCPAVSPPPLTHFLARFQQKLRKFW